MKNMKAKGYINGIVASVSYGTNPLFALPMFARGMGANSVLFYRYCFAVIIYGLWLKLHKKISLKISLKETGVLAVLGVLFSVSSLLLFEAFNYMEAGLACTILFAYPLMVALLSRFLFKEKLSRTIWLALIAAMSGMVLLYNGKPGGKLSLTGIGLVLLSSLAYALYIIGVRQIKLIKHFKSDKLTFYVMLFGLSVYIVNLHFCTQLQPFSGCFTLFCGIMLALFPTIISIESINIAIKLIGATKTAILGVLEPLTALFFGVLLFGEQLTPKIICGIILIFSGVIMVVLHKSTKK